MVLEKHNPPAEFRHFKSKISAWSNHPQKLVPKNVGVDKEDGDKEDGGRRLITLQKCFLLSVTLIFNSPSFMLSQMRLRLLSTPSIISFKLRHIGGRLGELPFIDYLA